MWLQVGLVAWHTGAALNVARCWSSTLSLRLSMLKLRPMLMLVWASACSSVAQSVSHSGHAPMHHCNSPNMHVFTAHACIRPSTTADCSLQAATSEAASAEVLAKVECRDAEEEAKLASGGT